MWDILSRRSKSHLLRCIFLFGIIFIIGSGILGQHSISNVAIAYTMIPNNRYLAPVTCSSPAVPTGQSILVILLDRSGSLYDTDPNGYSTSVTKALADLWPGTMIVIPFGDPLLNDPNSTVPVLPVYKAILSDPTQRDALKENVQNYPIKGGTPLAPAMRKALSLPEVQNAAQGSRVIIITDGGP